MQRQSTRSAVAGPQRAQRRLRVGEELRHALARILRDGELRDPALADASITVSEVRLGPDLRNATVYVMPLAGAATPEIMAGLRRSAPFLRGVLARTVSLRRVPSLAFALDQSFDEAARIAALLQRPEVARDLHPPEAAGDGRDDG